jgi:hypothetical protein
MLTVRVVFGLGLPTMAVVIWRGCRRLAKRLEGMRL